MSKRDKKGRFIKVDKISLVCKSCKKKFMILPSEIIRHGKKREYCSRECAFKNRKGKPSPLKGVKIGKKDDNLKYWTEKRKKLLISNWEFASEEELKKLFPGKSLSAIKNQINYIKKWDGYDVPSRKRTGVWKYEEKIIRLYQNGLGSHQIADKFKTHHSIILTILKKNKIKRRDNSTAQKLLWNDEKKKKKSEEVKKWGKKNPIKRKERIERLHQFHIDNPEFRSKKMKEWLNNNYDKFCKIMKIKSNTPEARERLRLIRLNQVFPLQDSSIEIRLQKELSRRKIPYTKHHLLFYNKKPIRQADIAFPEKKIIVECDGDYWHGNTKVFKELNEMQKKRIEKDKKQDILIRKAGWTIIRIWESDINKDVKKCVDSILKLVE